MIACFQILLITTISYCDFVYANVSSYEINIVKTKRKNEMKREPIFDGHIHLASFLFRPSC